MTPSITGLSDNTVSTLQAVRSYFCPLIKREVSEVLCYDINSVAFGLCKPSLINHVTNREDAEPICENCDNRAM